ncbi:uncharacterized protein LOC143909573 [Arctopsyche grandis]|uniref:uncharacterized protein LOC143909573 n=1 Tax=Arctopsyche grandis TaxID=121162 RepID=UPI00406D74D3
MPSLRIWIVPTNMANLWTILVFASIIAGADLMPAEELQHTEPTEVQTQPSDAAGFTDAKTIETRSVYPEYSEQQSEYPKLPTIIFYIEPYPSHSVYPRQADSFDMMPVDNVPAGSADFARCHYDDYGYKHKHHKKHWKKKFGMYDDEDEEMKEKPLDDHNIFLYNYNAQSPYSMSSPAPMYASRYYRSADYSEAPAPTPAYYDSPRITDRYDDYEIENSHNSKYKYKMTSKYKYDTPGYYETSYVQNTPTIEYNGAVASDCPCKGSGYGSEDGASPYERSAHLINLPSFSRARNNEAPTSYDDERVGCCHHGYKHHHKYMDDDEDDDKKEEPNDDEPKNIYIYNSNSPNKYRAAEGFTDLGAGFVDFAGKAGSHIHKTLEADSKKILQAITALSGAYVNAFKPFGSDHERQAARFSYPGIKGKPFLGLLKSPYKIGTDYDVPYHADFATKVNHNHDEMVLKYGTCPYCGSSKPHFQSPYLKNLGIPTLSDYISAGLKTYKIKGDSPPLVFTHELQNSKGSGVADYGSYGSPPTKYGSNLGLYGSPAFGIKKAISSDNQPVYSVVEQPAVSYTSVY